MDGVASLPRAKFRAGYGSRTKNMTKTSVATSHMANNACTNRIRKKRR